ncbi:hypothetical protein GOBAR_AA38964 [Gossypium barbadense]|uniref:Uncharacterized protein n=1 Tax=Gossypium barbadense TaxID=3634 RepID=A0A2P5VSH6_GOSBA|nr:hypothetical protein GOBAR_AA38964 [Gossypium barbadense]
MKQSPFKLKTITKNAYEPCSNNNKGPTYEERRLQIEELGEWRTQKLRTLDKPKPSRDELNISPNQLKDGDKVLLDAADPRITTSEPNEKIPLMVLSIFPYGTVEVIHPKFSNFKVNNTRLKPYVDKVDSRDEEWQDFSQTWDAISCHGRATWPWTKLSKQHGHETHSCLETVVETENVTWACDTPVPSTCGRHCQNEHGRGPMYTGVGEVNEARHGTISSSRGKNTAVLASKKRKGVASSSGPTMEIKHPFLQAALEQIQLADAVRALLSTDPWGLFFKIVELTPVSPRWSSTPVERIRRVLVPASATYDPNRSKASALPPSLRYLHAILAHTLTGRRENIGVVTTHDASFLWSMANGHVIDLAYFIAFAIHHQTEQHRRGYCLAQSTEEEDLEDILDDVPLHHEDPPTQPHPLSSKNDSHTTRQPRHIMQNLDFI